MWLVKIILNSTKPHPFIPKTMSEINTTRVGFSNKPTMENYRNDRVPTSRARSYHCPKRRMGAKQLNSHAFGRRPMFTRTYLNSQQYQSLLLWCSLLCLHCPAKPSPVLPSQIRLGPVFLAPSHRKRKRVLELVKQQSPTSLLVTHHSQLFCIIAVVIAIIGRPIGVCGVYSDIRFRMPRTGKGMAIVLNFENFRWKFKNVFKISKTYV